MEAHVQMATISMSYEGVLCYDRACRRLAWSRPITDNGAYW